MSKMITKTDKKGNVNSVILDGAQFFYTRCNKPVPIYDDRKIAFEKARKEWKTDVAVDEDTADAWDELFAKQPAKKLTNAKFMEIYKLEDESQLPFPDAKKQFVIKLTQKAQTKDGKPTTQPKVLEVLDGKAVEITNSKNVGNGSKGKVKVRVMSNDYGTFSYLDTLLVNELVEYESSGTVVDTDLLGDLEVEMESEEVKQKAREQFSKGSAGDDFSESSSDEPEADDVFEDDDFE